MPLRACSEQCTSVLDVKRELIQRRHTRAIDSPAVRRAASARRAGTGEPACDGAAACRRRRNSRCLATRRRARAPRGTQTCRGRQELRSVIEAGFPRRGRRIAQNCARIALTGHSLRSAYTRIASSRLRCSAIASCAACESSPAGAGAADIARRRSCSETRRAARSAHRARKRAGCAQSCAK